MTLALVEVLLSLAVLLIGTASGSSVVAWFAFVIGLGLGARGVVVLYRRLR
jgi:hypothetical protein